MLSNNCSIRFGSTFKICTIETKNIIIDAKSGVSGAGQA